MISQGSPFHFLKTAKNVIMTGMLSSLLGCASLAPDESGNDRENDAYQSAQKVAAGKIYKEMETMLEAAQVPASSEELLAMRLEGSSLATNWSDNVDHANQLVEQCLQLTLCDSGKLARFQTELLQRQSKMMQFDHELIVGLQGNEVDGAEPEERDHIAAIIGPEDTATPTESSVSQSEEHKLQGRKFTAMIPMNEPVKAALDDWLTWGRPRLLLAYENYQYLRPLIAPVYEKAGFPEPLLFAMIATESTGKAHAKSRAGAAGILQFMRFTGKKYGLRKVNGFDQRYDPVKATQANARYLKEHLKLFHNSLEKTLAAYNGGENRMLRLQRKYKGKSLWDKRIYYALPRETRNYVPKVLAAAWLFMHPEQYRLTFPKVNSDLVKLTVTRDTSMSELGVCLGQQGAPRGWFRTLRNLNPKIKPEEVVEMGTTLQVPQVLKDLYQSNCEQTDEKFLQMAKEMHRANYPDGSQMTLYVVRKGDTANRIAARFECVSTRELTAINKIRPPRYILRVGQVLQVPEC